MQGDARTGTLAAMPADPPKRVFLKRDEGNSRYQKGGLASARKEAQHLARWGGRAAGAPDERVGADACYVSIWYTNGVFECVLCVTCSI